MKSEREEEGVRGWNFKEKSVLAHLLSECTHSITIVRASEAIPVARIRCATPYQWC